MFDLLPACYTPQNLEWTHYHLSAEMAAHFAISLEKLNPYKIISSKK